LKEAKRNEGKMKGNEKERKNKRKVKEKDINHQI
jgi:hypothetical protein